MGMTIGKEEIIDFCNMKAQLEPENEDIFKAIIKVLEQELTKNDLGVDCISREDVLQILWDYDYVNENALVIKDIKALPSVTSREPKIGYWIDTNDDCFVYHIMYKCSHCGNTVCDYPENMQKYKYCSNCGAKMEVENRNDN